MKTIREIFSKPIDRTIEGSHQGRAGRREGRAGRVGTNTFLHRIPPRTVFTRFTRKSPLGLRGIHATRGIGIWVSGFFGSGKSLFAKILGYTVARPEAVGTKTASELFKSRSADDPQVAALLDSITTRIPFRSVIFDVSMDRGVRLANERLTEIVYKALLRELDYAEDFDLAELRNRP